MERDSEREGGIEREGGRERENINVTQSPPRSSRGKMQFSRSSGGGR